MEQFFTYLSFMGGLALGPAVVQTAPTLTNAGATLTVQNGTILYVAGGVQQMARYAVGQVYYRLRQVDTNGDAAYSPVRLVQVTLAAGLLVQAYPNPSALGQDVTLSLRTDQAGAATLLLTDVLGRPVGRAGANPQLVCQ